MAIMRAYRCKECGACTLRLSDRTAIQSFCDVKKCRTVLERATWWDELGAGISPYDVDDSDAWEELRDPVRVEIPTYEEIGRRKR